jgi:YtkA-like
MRKAILGGALLAAFTFATPAGAGCWATVGLAPPPNGLTAGETWTAELKILQHGRNPLPDAADAKPTVTISKGATGDRKTFTAKATDPAAGLYEAEVVFPSPGLWDYEVFDGFTSEQGEEVPCARTHTLGEVRIGGSAPSSASAGAFPFAPLGGGLGALLLAGIGVLYVKRRNGLQQTVTKT